MCLFTTTLESARVAGLVEEEIGKAWKLVELEFIFLLEAQTLHITLLYFSRLFFGLSG